MWPKSCGHVQSKFKEVVPRAEAVARVRAACDARREGADILIVARTDARQVCRMLSSTHSCLSERLSHRILSTLRRGLPFMSKELVLRARSIVRVYCTA